MEETEYNFQKLTPDPNVKLEIYKDAIDFAFKHADILNIAISGPYGAGKSSIIESYKAQNSEKKFLHISLAHFESKVDNQHNEVVLDQNANQQNKVVTNQDENKSTCYKEENTLEGKIINQLIHQIDPDKIQQTNFKIKRKINTWDIMKTSFFVMIFSILLAYTTFFENWVGYINSLPECCLKFLIEWTSGTGYRFLSGLICTMLLGCGLYSTLKLQANRSILKKVKLQGNEIEVFSHCEEAYFDKHLNEVLYLFENSGVDVIVFEDIDRYNTNQIFEKLREINGLLNKNTKKIRFFYLIRDDLFISKDRTKFFDFIIPIVPVMDSSNSYDQFIEHLQKGNLIKQLDNGFLQGLSLYIDDMRILKNIYNEFVIYNHRITDTELDKNKLLSIIVYKNIFPKDFSELHLGRGFVYNLFQQQSILANNKIDKINEDIKIREAKIAEINNELCLDIDELNALYFVPLRGSYLEVNGQSESQHKTRTEFVRALKSSTQNILYNDRYNNIWANKSDIDQDFSRLKQNSEYVKRKKNIESKMAGEAEKLNEEIEKLKAERRIILESTVKNLINKDNINEVFNIVFKNEINEINEFKEIKGSPYFDLIKYLIRNGYLDETYADYMTYFYENSLSRNDKIFLRSITDQRAKEYTYRLKNFDLLLAKLKNVDFSKPEILNFDLLLYLLKEKSININYLTDIYRQLEKSENYNFIEQFFSINKSMALFIEDFNRICPNMCYKILQESNMIYDLKKLYVINTLYCSSKEELEKLNRDNGLKYFIAMDKIFLEVQQPRIDRIIDGLICLDVRFNWIDIDRANKELFNEIYNHNLYEININFIELLLKVFYKLEIDSDFKQRNYTLIKSQSNQPIIDYIENNLNLYLNLILENCEGCITDDEEIAESIINNENINQVYKERYIEYLKTIFSDINKISGIEQQGRLLERTLVEYNSDNILSYFCLQDKKIDDKLTHFINCGSGILKFNSEEIDNKFGENTTSNFYNAIVVCENLVNEKYETLLKLLNRHYKNFSKKNISTDKISILINLNIIRMNDQTLDFIRANYSSNLIEYIKFNISQYIKNIENEEKLNYNEMLLLLDEKDISDDNKIALIDLTNKEISIANKNYSKNLKLKIIQDHFDSQDLALLLQLYPKADTQFRDTAKNIFIKNIDEIIENQYSMEFITLFDLIQETKIDLNIRQEVFSLYLSKFDKKQIKKCLTTLQMIDYLNLFEGKRPRFEINDINERILNVFKDKQWITDFDVDKKDNNFYRAIGRFNE